MVSHFFFFLVESAGSNALDFGDVFQGGRNESLEPKHAKKLSPEFLPYHLNFVLMLFTASPQISKEFIDFLFYVQCNLSILDTLRPHKMP